MRLQQVRVQNFRSIVDSGDVPIEERVTVIVGKNEQGKTNFLRALESFEPSYAYSPSDLPNHLRPTLESRDGKTIPVVTLTLVPEPTDQIRDMIPDADAIKHIEVTRFFDGHYAYRRVEETPGMGDMTSELKVSEPNIKPHVEEIIRQAENLRAKLKAHSTRLPAFASSLPQAASHIDQFVKSDFNDHKQIDNLIKTFITALNGLPNQDQAVQQDIAMITKEIQGKQAEIQQLLANVSMSSFTRRIPSFLFHSSMIDKIPNEVNVAAFVADPEKTSKGMSNLCAVAGLSAQKIKELASSTDTSARESYEDFYRGSVSGGINEFWTQMSYDVHFRIEKERLSVSISDDSYSPRIPPSERSDGFQWYLSFYCALVNEVSRSIPMVLLLDNPGLEVHSDGQHDIKRFLEERMPPSTQVIYVTHSPAMIDPYQLEQIRKVELQGGMQGTKVTELSFATDGFDLLEPVRSAIGAKIVSSLIVNDFNVLVEGAADKPILEGAFRTFLEKDKAKKILVNGSVAETKDAFLPRFYQQVGLPFVVYLDADSGGRELAGALKKWKISDEKIVQLGNVFGSEDIGFGKSRDFALEDVLNQEFYHKAVRKTYPDYEVPQPDRQICKRANYYEDAFKKTHAIGFSKRRVAETVKEMLISDEADSTTRDRLEGLASAIWKALEAQTAPSVSRRSRPAN